MTFPKAVVCECLRLVFGVRGRTAPVGSPGPVPTRPTNRIAQPGDVIEDKMGDLYKVYRIGVSGFQAAPSLGGDGFASLTFSRSFDESFYWPGTKVKVRFV